MGVLLVTRPDPPRPAPHAIPQDQGCNVCAPVRSYHQTRSKPPTSSPATSSGMAAPPLPLPPPPPPVGDGAGNPDEVPSTPLTEMLMQVGAAGGRRVVCCHGCDTVVLLFLMMVMAMASNVSACHTQMSAARVCIGGGGRVGMCVSCARACAREQE